MKKVITAGVLVAAIAASTVTTQSTYACFGLDWLKNRVEQHTNIPKIDCDKTPVVTTTPAPETTDTTDTSDTTTPTDTPVATVVDTTATPVVTTASISTPTTTAATISTSTTLPETGIGDNPAVTAGLLGIGTYVLTFAVRRVFGR